MFDYMRMFGQITAIVDMEHLTYKERIRRIAKITNENKKEIEEIINNRNKSKEI